ncbi:MAG: insulinase family protein [Deltaproteobacteria bacterium]|nr:insulinase family protein [Deltaproteobacteria bacterium]
MTNKPRAVDLIKDLPRPSYLKRSLSNGVTLIAEKHPQVCSVSVGVWVRAGSCSEEPKRSGVAHFLEHMVFKGTQKRTALEIATIIESLGGELNAFTDREFTCYHATVLSKHIDVALDVLSDLVLRPNFAKKEIEREKKVLLQEMAMVEETPDEWVGDLLFQTVWKGEPLGQPIIGTRKTVRDLSQADLQHFFTEHYCADNMIVAVAGNIDFEALLASCEKCFGSVPARKTLLLSAMPSQYKNHKRFVYSDCEQVHFLAGYQGVGFKDPYRFDALILSFFLGGGMSSCLFQEVREKAALAYSVECEMVPFTGTGLLTIYVATASKWLIQCQDIIARELARLKSSPISQQDLDVVKGQLSGMILLSSDQMESRQESLGRNEIIFGRYVPVEEVIDEIGRVDSERVWVTAKNIFIKGKESAVVLGKHKVNCRSLSMVS